MFMRSVALGLFILGFSISAAQAGTVCTIVANAKSGDVLQQEGDCYSRVTPASTFKIAISLMGFDAAFLQDEHFPTLPYHPGDPGWGGAAWLEPTDAVRWFQYSVQARPSLEWRTEAAMKPTDTAGLSAGRQG
jgi:beta-lactamase class D